MSGYTKEAERLIIDQIAAKFVSGNNVPVDSVRITADEWSALLAHIQRGVVPEGWQLVPKEPTPEMISYTKSVEHCGSREPHTSNIYRAMLAAAPAHDHFRDAAKMMPEPAKVPMPEPVARMLEWRGRLARNPPSSARTFEEFPPSEAFPAKKDAYWSNGKLLVLADEARTYGDDREAAGYARGLAEAGRDAERRGQFLIECDDVALRVGPAHLGLCDAIDNDGQPYQSQALADEITALRGEVK